MAGTEGEGATQHKETQETHVIVSLLAFGHSWRFGCHLLERMGHVSVLLDECGQRAIAFGLNE